MTAALDLMWDEGYSAVTIDEICDRADVKKGSFYYFFKSKAELAIAALEKLWIDDWKPRLDREFSPSVEPLNRLTNYLDALYTRQAEHFKKYGKVLGCPIGSVGSEVSTQEHDVNAKVREIGTRKQRYFESAIRDAIAEGAIEPGDARQKAQTLLFLIQGALSEARIMNNAELLRNLPATALQMLRAKPAPAATAAR
ncbi:MAG TPA: TetR/AcrR family transcriptional regulator [Opitutaceae bacterium]|nr:TetR/AcrR family transcriptional regulator [Opitutaceae bacterium]